MIGLLWHGEYHVFWANNYSEEKRMLLKFKDFLNKYTAQNLITYSGCNFDYKVLKSAFTRLKISDKCLRKFNHFDACTDIKRSIIVPIQSYSLKDLGKYMGFDFGHNLDGKIVSMRYEKLQEKNLPIPDEFFSYLKNDVISIPFIIKKIKGISQSKSLNKINRT